MCRYSGKIICTDGLVGDNPTYRLRTIGEHCIENTTLTNLSELDKKVTLK